MQSLINHRKQPIDNNQYLAIKMAKKVPQIGQCYDEM
jgi:hypothetical protein